MAPVKIYGPMPKSGDLGLGKNRMPNRCRSEAVRKCTHSEALKWVGRPMICVYLSPVERGLSYLLNVN